MLRFLRGWVVPLVCLSVFAACDDADEGEFCIWPEIECGGECVDASTSLLHCGACDNACDEGDVCIDGVCGPVCPEGFEDCDGVCVDLQDDPEHCGSCGTTCDAGMICVAGACEEFGDSCDEGLTLCGNECVDTESADAHCGDCDVACGEGASCVQGSCACEDGLQMCEGACVDTDSDASHCGACGEACDDGLVCTDGVCGCGAGESFCDDACIPTKDDPENCGDCGVSCADLPNIDTMDGCAEGACVFTCAEGYDSCDGDWQSGCETDLTTVENCGACGNDCTEGGNVEAAACVSGACEIVACVEGFARCDASAPYGCETDIRVDPAHCGDCGQVCDTTLPKVAEATCAGGACEITCATGYDNCDDDPSNGCESEVDADILNCGACGKTCEHFCKDNTCGNIQAIGVGMGFACASLEGGSVYCWGDNEYGKLGDGTSTMRLAPTPVTGLTEVKSQAGTAPFTCAVGQDDYVYCWGRYPLSTDSMVPARIEGLGKAKQVSVGWYHVCAVVENGDVYCWGQNDLGQLGDGSNTNREEPVKVVGVANVVDLDLNYRTSCAVQANGELYCWGENPNGAFADGTTNGSNVAKKIDLSGITKVSVGVGLICVVNEDGEVLCAGWGEYGQLGDGNFQNRNTFVKVDSTVEFADVAVAAYTSCALAADGTVWCWGQNELGMMGSPGPASGTPRQVVNINAATALERGAEEWTTFCALSTGQGMFCWGLNNGALGIDPMAQDFSDTPVLIEF